MQLSCVKSALVVTAEEKIISVTDFCVYTLAHKVFLMLSLILNFILKGISNKTKQ